MDIKSPVAEARNEYTYSASGAKLKVVQKWNSTYYLSPVIGATINPASLNSSRTMDYVGNIIYENNALDKILVDGGYIEGGVYYFYITDHLGNNRIVANSSGASEQSTHYYPFGTSFVNASGTHPYQYNGKELDQMHGLNLYDYSARYYESAIGRFTTVDPHAENYYSWSPYAYVMNNPLKYIDPTGMDSIYFQSTFVPPTPGFRDMGLNRQDTPYEYKGTYTTGEGGENVAMVDLAVTEVSPDYAYEIGGVIRNYDGDIIGEKPLERVYPEFEILTMGRGTATTLARKAISNATAEGYSVYRGVDASGKIRYIGITSREPAIRFAEHAASGTVRAGLNYRVIDGARGLTNTFARIQEQNLINQYGLQKNGGLLYNKINSIAPINWGKYGIKP